MACPAGDWSSLPLVDVVDPRSKVNRAAIVVNADQDTKQCKVRFVGARSTTEEFEDLWVPQDSVSLKEESVGKYPVAGGKRTRPESPIDGAWCTDGEKGPEAEAAAEAFVEELFEAAKRSADFETRTIAVPISKRKKLGAHKESIACFAKSLQVYLTTTPEDGMAELQIVGYWCLVENAVAMFEEHWAGGSEEEEIIGSSRSAGASSCAPQEAVAPPTEAKIATVPRFSGIAATPLPHNNVALPASKAVSLDASAQNRSHGQPEADGICGRASMEIPRVRPSVDRTRARPSVDNAPRRMSIERVVRRSSLDRVFGRPSLDKARGRPSLDKRFRRRSLDVKSRMSLDDGSAARIEGRYQERVQFSVEEDLVAVCLGRRGANVRKARGLPGVGLVECIPLPSGGHRFVVTAKTDSQAAAARELVEHVRVRVPIKREDMAGICGRNKMHLKAVQRAAKLASIKVTGKKEVYVELVGTRPAVAAGTRMLANGEQSSRRLRR